MTPCRDGSGSSWSGELEVREDLVGERVVAPLLRLLLDRGRRPLSCHEDEVGPLRGEERLVFVAERTHLALAIDQVVLVLGLHEVVALRAEVAAVLRELLTVGHNPEVRLRRLLGRLNRPLRDLRLVPLPELERLGPRQLSLEPEGPIGARVEEVLRALLPERQRGGVELVHEEPAPSARELPHREAMASLLDLLLGEHRRVDPPRFLDGERLEPVLRDSGRRIGRDVALGLLRVLLVRVVGACGHPAPPWAAAQCRVTVQELFSTFV